MSEALIMRVRQTKQEKTASKPSEKISSVIKGIDPFMGAELLFTLIEKGNSRYRDSTYERTSTICELRETMDKVLCDSSGQFKASITGKMNDNILKNEKELKAKISDFLSTHTDEIISLSTTNTEEWNNAIATFTDSSFLESLNKLNSNIATALGYEMRLTGNISALASRELFTDNSVRFLNNIGPESASEWLNSVGQTGNLSTLTSEMATSEKIASLVKEDPKLASELSYALANSDNPNMLLNPSFIDSVYGMDVGLRSEFMSAIWVTGKPAELIDRAVSNNLTNDITDLWQNTVRGIHSDSHNGTIIVSKSYDDVHDRGVKLFVQSMRNTGYDVIYVSEPTNPEIITHLAKTESAKAIAFSFMGESYLHLVEETMNKIKSTHSDEITFIGGGFLTENMIKSLENKGVRIFSPSSGIAEISSFLIGSDVSKNAPYVIGNYESQKSDVRTYGSPNSFGYTLLSDNQHLLVQQLGVQGNIENLIFLTVSGFTTEGYLVTEDKNSKDYDETTIALLQKLKTNKKYPEVLIESPTDTKPIILHLESRILFINNFPHYNPNSNITDNFKINKFIESKNNSYNVLSIVSATNARNPKIINPIAGSNTANPKLSNNPVSKSHSTGLLLTTTHDKSSSVQETAILYSYKHIIPTTDLDTILKISSMISKQYKQTKHLAPLSNPKHVYNPKQIIPSNDIHHAYVVTISNKTHMNYNLNNPTKFDLQIKYFPHEISPISTTNIGYKKQTLPILITNVSTRTIKISKLNNIQTNIYLSAMYAVNRNGITNLTDLKIRMDIQQTKQINNAVIQTPLKPRETLNKNHKLNITIKEIQLQSLKTEINLLQNINKSENKYAKVNNVTMIGSQKLNFEPANILLTNKTSIQVSIKHEQISHNTKKTNLTQFTIQITNANNTGHDKSVKFNDVRIRLDGELKIVNLRFQENKRVGDWISMKSKETIDKNHNMVVSYQSIQLSSKFNITTKQPQHSDIKKHVVSYKQETVSHGSNKNSDLNAVQFSQTYVFSTQINLKCEQITTNFQIEIQPLIRISIKTPINIESTNSFNLIYDPIESNLKIPTNLQKHISIRKISFGFEEISYKNHDVHTQHSRISFSNHTSLSTKEKNTPFKSIQNVTTFSRNINLVDHIHHGKLPHITNNSIVKANYPNLIAYKQPRPSDFKFSNNPIFKTSNTTQNNTNRKLPSTIPINELVLINYSRKKTPTVYVRIEKSSKQFDMPTESSISTLVEPMVLANPSGLTYNTQNSHTVSKIPSYATNVLITVFNQKQQIHTKSSVNNSTSKDEFFDIESKKERVQNIKTIEKLNLFLSVKR